MIGKSLGPYKIIETLGAGGMFAADPERLARYRVPHPPAQPTLRVVLGWFEELNERVPTGR